MRAFGFQARAEIEGDRLTCEFSPIIGIVAHVGADIDRNGIDSTKQWSRPEFGLEALVAPELALKPRRRMIPREEFRDDRFHLGCWTHDIHISDHADMDRKEYHISRSFRDCKYPFRFWRNNSDVPIRCRSSSKAGPSNRRSMGGMPNYFGTFQVNAIDGVAVV